MTPWSPERRARAAEGLGLTLILLVLLDCFRPELLALPTIMAGGDTPCHFPTLVWLHEKLLPQGRLHGWYPGAYLGQPLLLYYFPLPFLVMSGVSVVTGLEVAFKVGAALGVFLVPPCAWACFRMMGFRSPAPLLAAAASLVFLFCEENPIWGGTIASTLTGEIAYTYGTALAVLFLGALWRTYERGGSPLLPGILLAVTALAHGYAVLWAGLSASFLLYAARRPARTLGWLAGVALLGFCGAAFFLVPLLADWGWTTPYNDAWIDVTRDNLLPPLLWPLFALAAAGLVAPLVARRVAGPFDPRVLFLAHAALVAAALALAGGALGIIDIRFVPFAHLALCLVAAGVMAAPVRGAAAPSAVALGLTLLGVAYADASSRVVRPWIDYNMTGLQAKELWPRFERMVALVRGPAEAPRVAVEYSTEHEKAGSIRMYETLPWFTGRGTLEGVYNQASLQTHFVYYVSSILGASSPNPFRSREYGTFDTDAAVARLALLGARDVVALSPQLHGALSLRPGVSEVGSVAPYRVFRLPGPEGGAAWVEPLAFVPMAAPRDGWRDRAYRWFTRHPLPRAHLVFDEDPALGPRHEDPWLAPPEHPAAHVPQVSEVRVEAERIRFRVDRPGSPVLVKVSYHPRWRATGARGPYLASPALMVVVPTAQEVTLEYEGRNANDWLGLGLTAAAIVACVLLARYGRSPRGPETEPAGGLRWGGVVPATLLLALAGLRLAHVEPKPDPELGRDLQARAEAAWAEGRWAQTADYAGHAVRLAPADRKTELQMLRAESLLRAGHVREAYHAFSQVADAASPYRPQALHGKWAAATAAGFTREARAARDDLRAAFPDTPWARKVGDGP
jgi:hypothetical protein